MQLNRRLQRGDEGFTLIELVMTISIMTIIMASLIGMVFLYMKTTNATQNKLSESTDQQFASAYWQQDVSSLGVRGIPAGDGTAGAPSQSVWTYATPSTADSSLTGACGSHSNAIAAFSWNDYQNVPSGSPSSAWNATANAAVYYTKTVTTNGVSQIELWRIRCGGVTSDTRLARFLDPSNPPNAACFTSSGGPVACSATHPFPATLSLTITVRDYAAAAQDVTGYTSVLSAESRQQ